MAKIRKVPKKYTAGLKPSTAAKRKAAIRKRQKGEVSKKSMFKPLPGDSKKSTKKSKYTKSLKIRDKISSTAKKLSGTTESNFVTAVSRETGIPKAIINDVYKRGAAAWGTSGHRVGASQAAWAKARVYSFIQKGKTATTADSDLYLKAKKQQKGNKYKLK